MGDEVGELVRARSHSLENHNKDFGFEHYLDFERISLITENRLNASEFGSREISSCNHNRK